MTQNLLQEPVSFEPSSNPTTVQDEITRISHFVESSTEQEAHWATARMSLNAVVEEFLELYPYHSLLNGQKSKTPDLHLGTYDASVKRAPSDLEAVTQLDQRKDEDASTWTQTYSNRLSEIRDTLSAGQLHRGWNLLGRLVKSVSENKTISGVPPSPDEEASQFEIEIDCLNFHLAFALGCSPHVTFQQNSRLCLWVAGNSSSGDVYHVIQKELFLMIRKISQLDFTYVNDVLEFLDLFQIFGKRSSPGCLDRLLNNCSSDNDHRSIQMRLQANAILFAVSCRVASICGRYASKLCSTYKSNHDLKKLIAELNLRSPSRKHEAYCKTVEYAGQILEAFCALCQSGKKRAQQDWINRHPAMIAAMVVAIAEARKSKWKLSRMLQTLRGVENLFGGLGEPSLKAGVVDDAIRKIRSMSKDTVSPYTLITSQEDASAAESEQQSKSTTVRGKRKRDKEIWVALKSRRHSNPSPKKSCEVKPRTEHKVSNKVRPDSIHKHSASQMNGISFAPLDLLLEAGDRSGPCQVRSIF